MAADHTRMFAQTLPMANPFCKLLFEKGSHAVALEMPYVWPQIDLSFSVNVVK